MLCCLFCREGAPSLYKLDIYVTSVGFDGEMGGKLCRGALGYGVQTGKGPWRERSKRSYRPFTAFRHKPCAHRQERQHSGWRFGRFENNKHLPVRDGWRLQL